MLVCDSFEGEATVLILSISVILKYISIYSTCKLENVVNNIALLFERLINPERIIFHPIIPKIIPA